ncbi:hypothetical protein QUF72_14415 [Desulfobacterales bacterium HSG2]|nr:hypothetical protein [Desulfobacterales bacterium HSG2]
MNSGLNEERETAEVKDEQRMSDSGVDRGLIAMFLKMTPEERIQANDNAINAITELRNAFRQK